MAEWIWSKPDLSCTKHFISNQEEKRASTQIKVGGQIRVLEFEKLSTKV